MALPDQVTRGDFLCDLPADARAVLEPLARELQFAPGEKIFTEGRVEDDVYLIESGHVRLEMAASPTRRTQLMSLAPGDLLGWSPLLGDGPMTATAVALEPVRLLAFDGRDLRRACEANHELGYHVMKQLAKTLSQRLVATRLQLLDLFHDSSSGVAHAPTSKADQDPRC